MLKSKWTLFAIIPLLALALWWTVKSVFLAVASAALAYAIVYVTTSVEERAELKQKLRTYWNVSVGNRLGRILAMFK